MLKATVRAGFLALCALLLPGASALASAVGGVDPQSGIWWNPSQPGSGYALERQGQLVSIGAYLYESNGVATWYAGQLTRDADGVYSGAVTRFSGGQTLNGAYKAPDGAATMARLSLTAVTPTSGTVRIEPADGASPVTAAIERFAFSNPPYAVSAASFQSGMWWNEAEGGRGFFIDVQGALAVISGYMYEASGQPVWYLGNGAVDSGVSVSVKLDQYAGGQSLGGPYVAPVAVGSPGRISFSAYAPDRADLLLPGGRSLALKRFVFNQTGSLSLSATGDGFGSNGEAALEFPYAASGSVNANYLCVGSTCPSDYTLGSFKLSAAGQAFTLTNLQADNATNASTIVPRFQGLSEGQVVADGTSIEFSLVSPLTHGQAVDLLFAFTVKETSEQFQVAVTLTTN